MKSNDKMLVSAAAEEKKAFEPAVIETIAFASEDVITTSPIEGEGDFYPDE